MKKYGDRFYFGFSSFANMRANCHKTAAVIAAVPDDRLLLESDLEDPDDVPHALNTMLHTMVRVRLCACPRQRSLPPRWRRSRGMRNGKSFVVPSRSKPTR